MLIRSAGKFGKTIRRAGTVGLALFVVSVLGVAAVQAYPSGTQVWVRRYNRYLHGYDDARGIDRDAAGNIYVGANSNDTLEVLKYDTAGHRKWVAPWAGVSPSSARAIAVDRNGNSSLVGETGVEWDMDFVTLRFDSSGHRLWVRTYDGPSNFNESATDVAVDTAGNTYVTGWSLDGLTTIKYNSAGTRLWVARSGDVKSQPVAIGLDGSGNVYVTGQQLIGSGTTANFLTIKYDSSGVQQWVDLRSLGGRPDSHATDIAVTTDGHAYVTGRAGTHADDTSYDCETFGLNSAGGLSMGPVGYNGGHGFDGGSAIALDPNGNLVVAGTTQGVATGLDYLTLKYTSGGALSWNRTYSGRGSGADRAQALAVNGYGSIYVTGVSRGTSNDYATLKYDRLGNRMWARRYDGPAHKSDSANGVVCGSAGAFVTGSSWGSTSLRDDILTIRYAP